MQPLNTFEDIDAKIETSSDSGATAQLEKPAEVDATGPQEDNMTESVTEFKQESTADTDATRPQEDDMTESVTEFKQESTADTDATRPQEDDMTESVTEFKQESTADVDATGPQNDNMTESMTEFKASIADDDATGPQNDNMTESMTELKASMAYVDATGSQEDNMTESMTEFKQASITDVDMSNCETLVKKEDDSTPNIEQVSESTWYMQNPDCTISVNTDNDSSVLCPASNDVSTSGLSPMKVSESPMQEHGYSMAVSMLTMTNIDATVNHVQPDMAPVDVASGSTNILDETMEAPEHETKKRRSKRQREQLNSILLVIPNSSKAAIQFEGDLTPADSTDIEKQASDECHQFVKIEKTEPDETELTPVSGSSSDLSQTLIQAPEECHKIRKKRRSKAKPTDTDLAIVASLKSDTRPALKQPAEGFEEQTRQAFECICGDHEIEPDDVKPRAQCEKCGLWQHADCIKYDLSDSRRGRYLCPHCHAVVVSGHFTIPLYIF